METFSTYLKKFIPRGVFSFLQPVYHFLMAFFAALFYGFPSRHLTIIGVTGTNGKTTVVELLHEILRFAEDDGRGGTRVASISSLCFKIGDKKIKNELKMTMPGRFFVQKFLHRARKAGCKYAILEVTSEGIKQFRHRFIKVDVAVMTNIAPEHIEAHGGFENYLRAKLDLFWRLPKSGIAVINKDDLYCDRFSAATSAQKIFYEKEGVRANSHTRFIKDLEISPKGIFFDLHGCSIASSLIGEFNFYNILAAVSAAFSQHVSLERIASAVAQFSGIPGRMEYVQHEPFAVVIDYAHTPDSLKNVYAFLKESASSFSLPASSVGNPSRKLICVLGSAGGGRDRWKRPEMGKIAAQFCNEIILTNEDPYDENPAEILNEIEAGFSHIQNCRKILDRRKAIREALKSARAGDAVIITGKGSEPWIIGQNGSKISWNERKIVEKNLSHLTESELR